MRAWWPLLLLAAACTSCTSREVIPVEVSDLGVDFAFFAVTDGRGSPSWVSTVLAVEGAVGDAHAVLEDRAGEVVMIGFGLDGLERSLPGFDASRALSLAARVERPPTEPVKQGGGGELVVDVALPRDTRFFQVALDRGGALEELDARTATLAASLRSALTLAVPVDHTLCKQTPGEQLLPFAAHADALEMFPARAPKARSILRLVRVDADRVLAMAEDYLFLVHRGQPAASDPARPGHGGSYFTPIPFTATSTGTYDFQGIALDRGSGNFALTLVGVEYPPTGAVGRVWDLHLEADGIRFDATATIAAALISASIDDDGTLAAVDAQGKAYLRPRGAPALAPLPAMDMLEPLLVAKTRIVWTHDAEEPLVASSPNMLHVFQAASQRWVSKRIGVFDLSPRALVSPGEQFVSFPALAAFPSAQGVELWAGGTAGALFRRPAHGVWTRVELLPPPEYTPCSRPEREYPSAFISDQIDDMAAAGDRLYFTIRECSAIVEVARANLCAALVAPAGGQPGPVASQDVQALDLFEGVLIAGGEQGQLYERLRE